MNNTTQFIGMTRTQVVAYLNAAVNKENASRERAGVASLPYHGLPAGTIMLGREIKTYRIMAEIEVTRHEFGFSVYYAPVGIHIDFLPNHGDDAFAYAAEKKSHLSVVYAGGKYANCPR